MRQSNYKLLPALAIVLLAVSAPVFGRRVRVTRPVTAPAEDQEPRSQQLQYYAAAEDAGPSGGQQLVLVSDDAYNGLYGRQSIGRQSDVAAETYRPRSQIVAGSKTSRAKEAPRQPPVQTLSNYNKVNDDGSFTFGYEAADGSFKEETRGTDCVVRGKYGYVDPDGNKREFTYVSGNPCDPNAKNEEEEESKNLADEDSGEENVPKGPHRPLRPLRPLPARPTTTVFQNNYVQEEDSEETIPQQIYRTTAAPRLVSQRPTPASVYEQRETVTPRPTIRAQSAIRITPRPYSASTTVRSQLPATTYRPTLLQATPAPRPGVIYSSSAQPTPSPHAATAAVDFEETLRQFQLENNVLSTPRSVAQRPQARPQVEQQLTAGKPSGNALYETQLVYDPSSGQYQTVFYQNIPQTSNDISQRHRLQPFSQQPRFQQQQQQSQAQAQQPRQQQHLQQQQLYAQQQAQVLQQSQQLYAQQQQRQRALALQQPQPQQNTRFTQFQSPAQRYPLQQQYYQQQGKQLQQEPSRQFYYVSPQDEARESVSHGQIDSFLRNHNIAY